MKKVLYTDLELLEGLSKGDSNAIKEFYRLYHPIWVRWVLGRGGQESDAHDVFQEAIMVLYEKSKSVEFCLTCQLSTYLFAVSKRLLYRKIERGSQVHLMEEFSDEGLLPEESELDVQKYLEKEKQFDQLSEAMMELGEPCASLLKGFYMEQKSMVELAELFKYTNSDNAKTQKYKCLNRLRKIFFSRQSQVEKGNF